MMSRINHRPVAPKGTRWGLGGAVGFLLALFLLGREYRTGVTGPCAVISVKDEVMRSLPLSDPDGSYRFEDGGVAYTVALHQGQIALTEIDCPDRSCVDSGFIRDSGRDIVCLPNRLTVRISDGEAGEGSAGN